MSDCKRCESNDSTHFAEAERASRMEIEASIRDLSTNPLVSSLLDAADCSMIVLNRQRQILIGNAKLLEGLEGQGIRVEQGTRPGDAFGCIHASECPGGCGTSESCASCGAVLAIVESQRTGETAERECLMTVRRGSSLDALELRVRSSVVRIGTETFTIVGLRDISAEKRRDALERVFLHDMSNTVGPLVTWSELLAAHKTRDPDRLAQRIANLSKRLARDIQDQRVLREAERGTLKTIMTRIAPEAALNSAVAIVEGLSEARARRIEVVPGEPKTSVVTEESLLVRVLVNMLKNALEATAEGGTVRAWVEYRTDSCQLSVWNDTPMTPTVARQVFRRSFSTKSDRGRGLGTFSMKLFGEKYLDGHVGFVSEKDTGTVFFIRLPLGS